MEPEDREWIEKVLNNYKWDHGTVEEQSYKIVTSGAAAYRHMDLSSVSTRDLLNECYRRRAIEKFTGSVSVDSYMLREHPDTKEYAIRDLSRNVWDAMTSNIKFYTDALVVKENVCLSHMRNDFEAELYVCKHPTKVRK